METVQVNSTMPDNNTLVHAFIESDPNEELFLAIEKTLFYISCALTSATLIYGVTSWWFLQKFRNYRNYVFLNSVLHNFSVFLWYFNLVNMVRFMGIIITVGIFVYLAAARIFWLIVICHMFYVDIVKVFNGHIRRKYLKSALFGWGASLLTCIIQMLVRLGTGSSLAFYIIFVLPLILNTALYIVILWSLFRSSNASANTKSNKGRLLFIATLIFLLSDGFIFFSFLLRELKPSRTTKFVAFLLNRLMTSIILNVYLIAVKRNRELWYEYYVKKINERQRNRDMQMNVKNVRQTDTNRPAVINVQD